jgi:hypothetical protein
MILHALRVVAVVGSILAALAGQSQGAEPWPALLRRAGNAESETERYRLLRELENHTALPPVHRRELSALLPMIGYWAHENWRPSSGEAHLGENSFLAGFFFRREALDRHHFPTVPTESPLYPLHALYRGRMLIQTVLQSTTRRSFIDWTAEGRRLLTVAREAFPENAVIRMYLDEPISGWPREYPEDAAAPEWANLQREGLEKLADVIHWWIEHRQRPNGEFGGGWGDDVEMWRWWVPILIGFDDPVMAASQERLSDAIWREAHMAGGYSSIMTDVEHSSEDSTDSLMPMLHLRPDDPKWARRAYRIAELARERWMGVNERGQLQFKSAYFSVDEVSPRPEHWADTAYHMRVLQPAMLLWQRTGDTALGDLFSPWLRTWADATLRAERGKPPGIPPSTIRWPDGAVGGRGEKWWQPEIDSQAVYDWPSALSLVAHAWVLARAMTGDEAFVAPLAAGWEHWVRHGQATEGSAPGTLEWCGPRLGFIAEAVAKLQAVTGDDPFAAPTRLDAPAPEPPRPDSRTTPGEVNALIFGGTDPYVTLRRRGERGPLVAALRSNAEAFRSNWPAYTTECRWTDRVLRFALSYANRYADTPLPLPAPALLYATATGDVGSAVVLPLNAVRWRTHPREIAALVTVARDDRFEAELFHFGNEERALAAELFQLRPGSYRLELIAVDGRILDTQRHEIGPGTRIAAFKLPARRLCRLILSRE